MLTLGATLIGINNGDLRTFKTDLDHTLRIGWGAHCRRLCARGGKRHTQPRPLDVERLQAAGVDAILVGESLMASPDIGAAARRRAAGTLGRRGVSCSQPWSSCERAACSTRDEHEHSITAGATQEDPSAAVAIPESASRQCWPGWRSFSHWRL